MDVALVTGVSGFLGSAVARALALRGYSVRALVRPSSPRTNLDIPGIEVVEGLIHQRRRAAAAYLAVARFHQRYEKVPLDELRDITTDWVDTAMKLGDKSLQTMERILRAQTRRFDLDGATRRERLPQS